MWHQWCLDTHLTYEYFHFYIHSNELFNRKRKGSKQTLQKPASGINRSVTEAVPPGTQLPFWVSLYLPEANKSKSRNV